MAKIGMIGAGSWGTALALLCDKNGHEVTIWSIMKDEVEMLRTKRQHETKLPGVILPEKIEITNDLQEGHDGQGCAGSGSSFCLYQKHRPLHESLLKARPAHRQRGQGY